MARVMKSEGDGKHPSSHYLVVEDQQKPTTWHLRVRNIQGDVDPRLLGAAWAALHGGYRGNKYEGPNKEEAIRKLTRLYSSIGKKPPTSKAMFYRASDALWFLGVFSNNFQDAQDDILSEKAHEEYVGWLNQTGVQPPITVFHQPKYPDVVHILNYMALVYNQITPEEYTQNLETLYKPYAIAKTERVFYLNGFVFVIGKVYEHKRAVVEKLLDDTKSWGMSHGFIPVAVNANIIEKYRTFEFTIVPGEFSANKVTPISFIHKENMVSEELKSLSEEDREKLNDLLDGKAEDVEEATRKAKELLGDVIGSKTETPFNEVILKELTATFKAIEEVLQDLRGGVASLEQKQAVLESKMETLGRSEDERIAEKFVFPDFKHLFESQEEDEQENAERVEKLKEELPPPPVTDKTNASEENPLVGLFWSQFS